MIVRLEGGERETRVEEKLNSWKREMGTNDPLIAFEARHTHPNEYLQECSHIQNKPLLIEPRTNERQRHRDAHGREEGACRLIEAA